MALTYRGTKGSPLTIEEIDSNFAYFTGSHSITGSLTISGALYTTEPLLITGSLLPVDSGGTSLGDPELYFGELYLSSASVNFMGSPNNQIASIKAYGENVGNIFGGGNVYIAPNIGTPTGFKNLRGSFSVGTASYGIGTGSATFGRFVRADGNYQTVVGAFNQVNSNSNSFIIGNGASTGSRSNLLFASGSQVQVTGSLIVSGAATLSGNISFTTSGSGVIQTLTTIGANGTASYAGFSNTTASLNYGINLINYAASQDYCVKLPQPVTGKSVIVINKSGIDVKVFPSNIGGDINGNINGFAVVPSNGTSYAFNCYENPLPGGWSVLSTNGTTQTLTSEVISGSVGPKLYPAVGWENSKNNFAFINNTLKITGSSFAGMPPQFNFLVPTNDPQYQIGNSFNNNFDSYQWISSRQFPTDSWRRINSITLITNLTGSAAVTSQISWNMTLGFDTHFYFASDPTLRWVGGFWNNNTGYPNIDPAFTNWRNNVQIPWAAANDGNGHPLQTGFGGSGAGPIPSIVSITPGTFTAGGVSPYLAVNAGDPGTARFTINLPQQYAASFFGYTDLGARYISSFAPNQYYYNGISYVPVGLLDAYSVKCWGIGMYNNSSEISFPDLKISPQYNVTLN
jgi:hypothetical protein